MVKNRIRELRKEAGYNQKELGKILKVGQTTISAWEIGRSEPDSKSTYEMAKLFGCSIGYIMGYEDKTKYRGLSETEWRESTEKKRFEFEKEKELKELEKILNEENEEVEKAIERDEKYKMVKKWEQDNKAIFPEALEIDEIMEDLDKEQREALLDMVKLARKTFRQ